MPPSGGSPVTSVERRVLEAAQIALTLSDAAREERPYVWVNRAFERLTGYTAADVLGRSCPLLEGPEADPEVVEEIRGALRDAREARGLLRLRRPDGTSYCVEVALSPVRDDEGRVTHMLAVHTDVTSRVEAQSATKETEARYRSVVDAMGEGVVLQGADGRILAANGSAERILGAPLDQMQGQTSADWEPRYIHEDGSPFPAVDHPASVSLRTGEAVDGVLMGVLLDGGAARWISISSRPLRHVGEPAPHAVVVSFSDVTAARALEREARQLADEQSGLRRVATAVAADTAPEEVFALVAEEAARLLGADAAGIGRLAGERKMLVVGAHGAGPIPDPGLAIELRPGDELTRMRETGEPITVNRYDPGEDAVPARHGYGCGAAAPVVIGREIWGAIWVNKIAPYSLPEGAAEQLGRFAELVGLAVTNAEQRARLAEQAATDPLTGLLNHRAFHQQLGRELGRARRHGRELALVVLDVDRFKEINDGSGHQHGDRVLREVADRLRDVSRVEDVIARLGGDEFALLMPECGKLQAYVAAERARSSISAHEVAGHRGITVSAGVCDLTLAPDADALLRLADGALYWSKVHGRDVTFIYDPATIQELSAQERAEHLQRSHAIVGIRALARAIDAKNPSTREHSDRVAGLAARLAQARDWSPERVAQLNEAALVHDVGKIGVPDQILLKPGSLTPAEYEAVKEHAALGARILDDVLDREQVAWVRSHHERPDGSGYPDGLAGDEIPEGAALLAAADAFDVMTTARPYSAPRTPEQAVEEIRVLAGHQFSAAAVRALEAVVEAGVGLAGAP